MWMFMNLKMLQVGNSAICFFVVITVYACFHFATLEEYYLGILRLPVCNGVSDGSIIMIGLFLLSGIIGTDVWTTSPCSNECGAWMNM
jgi:hypothetical protein